MKKVEERISATRCGESSDQLCDRCKKTRGVNDVKPGCQPGHASHAGQALKYESSDVTDMWSLS